MNFTYTKNITINADIDTTWEAIANPQFAADFLPEVKKDITKMGAYVQNTHRNAKRVMPAQATEKQNIAWTAQAGNRIELPRQDTQANIQAVEIDLIERGDATQVIMTVNYQPKLDLMTLETVRCLRGLFNMKANILKKELEMNNEIEVLQPAFA